MQPPTLKVIEGGYDDLYEEFFAWACRHFNIYIGISEGDAEDMEFALQKATELSRRLERRNPALKVVS